MTTQIQYIDRDVVVALQREAENESEISKLIRQISKAREELQITEANLAVIEESLSGRVKKIGGGLLTSPSPSSPVPIS